MGRYYYLSNGDEGKYWFAVQNSMDVTSFGGRENQSKVNWYFDGSDLVDINATITDTWQDLKRLGGNYKEIIKSGNIPLPLQEKGKILFKLCARLELGNKIRKCIRQTGDCEFEGEL
jgi:hypothetical protein